MCNADSAMAPPLPLGVEPRQRARDDRGVVFQRLIGYAQVGEALCQGQERLLRFEAGQRRAQADVNALAESDVRVWPAGDIEPVWIGELRRVVIGSAEDEQDAIALPYLLIANREIALGGAEGCQHGAIVAQQLFDGGLDHAWVLAQPVPLVAEAREGEQTVRQQVGRRF